MSINQVCFESDFNFSNEVLGYILSPSYNLTSKDLWPWYMTFDCMNMQKILYFIHKSSLVKIRLQLFKWGHFHKKFIQSYNLLWMTFDLDMWPLTSSSSNEASQVAFLTQVWLKSIKACGNYGQIIRCKTILTTDNYRQQQTTVDKGILMCLSC